MMNVHSLPDMRVEDPQLLARSVAESIETAIVFGELPDGMRLTEEIICQKTGVSRSPIREALRMLEGDGLLVREPRRGVRVSTLTIEDLNDLYTCRMALEGTASALVCERGTDQQIAAIRDAHLLCERMLEADDVRGHFRANVDMSRRLFEAANNAPLQRLLGTIHKQALRYRFLAYEKSREVREHSVRCNTQLIAAFMARDAETAARLGRASIEASHEVIKATLAQRLAPAEPARQARV